MADPEFLAETTRAKLDIDPVGGEDGAALVRDLQVTPPDIVQITRAAIRK